MNRTYEIDYTPPAGRKYLFTDDLVRITGIPATTWQKWRSLKRGRHTANWADAPPTTRRMSGNGTEAQKVVTE